MKVYIAGKITGDPGYHYHFHKAEAALYKRGTSPSILLSCRRE